MVAVRTISEGLRQEADHLRVTIVSPGFIRTDFTDTVSNPQVKAQLAKSRDTFAIEPDAIARAIAFAIEQPRPLTSARLSSAPQRKADRATPILAA
jgi:NADP-dependent 3-hydroxy acid dehydrogenase YdfG